jgi:hypothetical protein
MSSRRIRYEEWLRKFHVTNAAQIFNLPYRRIIFGRVSERVQALARCDATRITTCITPPRGEAATNMIQPRMNTDGHG